MEAVIVAAIASVPAAIAAILVAVIQNKKSTSAVAAVATSSQMSAEAIVSAVDRLEQSNARVEGRLTSAVDEFRHGFKRHDEEICEIRTWQVEHNATRHGGRRKKAA